MESTNRIKRVTIKGHDGRTISVGIDGEDASEFISIARGDSGWVTVVHSKQAWIVSNDPLVESYPIYSTLRKVSLPQNIVAEIHEEYILE